MHDVTARLIYEIAAARAAILANYGRLWGEAERFSQAACDAQGADRRTGRSPRGIQDETIDPEGEGRLAE